MNQASAFVDTAPETAVVRPRWLKRPMNLTGDGFLSPNETDGIVESVATHFRVSAKEIRGCSRKSHIMRARHVTAWWLRQTGMSYEQIGWEIGGRNHKTIMGSVARVEAERAGSEAVRRKIDRMVAALADQETATGRTSGDVSSSASSALSQDEGSRA